MNQLGVIDAVLTKDSDVFPLGAQCVLRVVPQVMPNFIQILNVDFCTVKNAPT